MTWTATAGDVYLAGRRQRLSAQEWRLSFQLRGANRDGEVRAAYPYLFYHFEPFQRFRIYNPIYGGVLTSFAPLNINYPGLRLFV